MTSSRLSLKSHFFLFLALMVLLVLAIAVGLTTVYDQELARATSARALSTLDQIADGVDGELRRIRLLAASVAQDDSLPLIAGLREQSDAAVVLQSNREITKRLDRLFGIVRHEVVLLLFFRADGSYESYRGSVGPEAAAMIHNSPSYRLALEQSGSTLVDSLEPVLTTNGTSRFQLAAAIKPDPSLGGDLEMIYLAMVPDFFNQIINRLELADQQPGNSFYTIARQDGSILFPTKELMPSIDIEALARTSLVAPGAAGGQIIHGRQHTYLATARTLDRVPWHIVYFSDWEQLTAGATRANIIALVFLFFVLLAFIVFFQSLHKAVLDPLDLLAAWMAGFSNGVPPRPSGLKVSPEFSQVFGQFDDMVQKIDLLTREKIEAERAALQFQINPHFLSNTLSALRFMAMMSKAEGMKSMIEALMEMMSYQLSSPANSSTISAELENIRRYEYIMKVRYGDTFDLKTQVEPGFEDHPLLTMLLQPIVENAIEHGLRNLSRRGEILIRVAGTDGPGYTITVRDNGSGIPAEKMRELLNPPAEKYEENPGSVVRRGRIGLYNVHKRVRNHYGPDHGLVLESQFGQYTKVIFQLPLLSGQESNHA